MGWIERESFGLFCPSFANEFVRREAFEGLEAATEIVAGNEVSQMLPKLIMAVVIIAFDGSVLDRPVHALDLSIGPRMFRSGRSMFDIVPSASVFEGMSSEYFAICDCFPDERNGRATSTWRGELDAIVGQNGVDLIWDGRDQAQQELSGNGRRGFLVQFDEGKLRCAINGDEHVELALLGANFGNVDMEIADRIGFELLPGGPVAFDISKLGNAVPLKAAMQGRACQVRNCRLQRVEAVVEGQ